MAAFSRELGVDLGTINTQVAEGNQILAQETNCCCHCG